ncbi:hypothetical protein F4U02_07785 [Acinetobacter haemolyticus]|uniref:Uncharacterized protein n=2 Tax=Acinetobacter haemolyticus TaxID=29430 RepID=A0A1L6KKM4_ACIHA|nr:hypothetical protein AHTJS_04025 [Acinetobacter haemolyticus]EEH70083.1 hypothetical protein HMPREF0023_0388 [Acinetobacter sp. ATCC 27244]EFF81743.1 hypothetical protein HMP0015_2752 [Acinetobacter haemolyticus ATCC 19194]ATZ67920.1 hypothetical protein BSR56_11540 [Acinetobacter haemolyticus]AZN68359.1 hypothetical protein DX910_08850 [Acinetobacter haemolyticus]
MHHLNIKILQLKSYFRKVKKLFNFSKMICKKLLDSIEYKNELCALRSEVHSSFITSKDYS